MALCGLTPKGGAANYNEIRLEDSKGKERVYIQAEKDMEVLVKHNEDRTVGANKTEQVTENKTVGVGGDLGETVSGMRTSTVTLLSAETVGLAKAMTCGAAYQVSVGAIMNTTVIGAKLEEVGLFRMTAVGGTSTERVRGKKKINSNGDMTLATKKVLNLTGGIVEWIDKVDPSQPKY